MRYPKLRELKEAIKALFTGPYTVKFPKEPTKIFDGFRGKPDYHEKDCMGCGACSRVCPSRVIDLVDVADADPPVRRLVLHLDACIYCGQCELYCPSSPKGIRLSKEYDLATFNRESSTSEVEKELVLCEVCGAVVATKAHLKWLYKRLGSLAYSNPTIVLGVLGKDNLALLDTHQKDAPFDRSDYMRVLCPTCRRAVIMKEFHQRGK